MIRLPLPLLALLGLSLPAAAQLRRAAPPAPFTIGVVETVHSAVLGEDRVLNIALPPGYHPDSAARYPVIYALDGGADEDFIHLAGLVQFAAFPWVEWLPPSIVVGIANVDRKRDLTFPTTVARDKADYPTTGGSAAFQRFLGEEVLPFVDSLYRTDGARTLIGQSFGGLFAAELLLEHPGLFDRYVIVSPSMWWDNGSLLQADPAFLRDTVQAPEAVFVAVGEEGAEMVDGARRLAALVGRSPKVRVECRELKGHDHGTILHQAVLDGIRWLKGR
ncbi:MAG: alpha/beta hydrolase [Flavobacteriales bacterium]|nr:Ferri-bacillibactin esterase BesA [Flavobacteriales bacterium]MCC6578401.1 alpha/beta hydrolase [Flavobacteriales bacterium]NUQ15924.1 alpha/beta hydrolase [Flavobacteriales bacterium]